MALARKFLFDVSFDAPDPPLEPGTPAFVGTDLEAARAEAYAAGLQAGLAEAAAGAEARTADAIGALADAAARLLEVRRSASEAIERDALALVRTVLQKAVPALCRRDPLAEFEALVAQCLGELIDEPRLVLRVADQDFDAIEARIGPLVKQAGFAGKLVLLADAALSAGDGRIEWADGGAERTLPRFMAELDTMLARTLSEESQNG